MVLERNFVVDTLVLSKQLSSFAKVVLIQRLEYNCYRRYTELVKCHVVQYNSPAMETNL